MPDPSSYGPPPGETASSYGLPPGEETSAKYGPPPGEPAQSYGLPPGETEPVSAGGENVGSQMMPSHAPTAPDIAPMPMAVSHKVAQPSALEKTAHYLAGSDQQGGWGDWNPKAMASQVVSGMDNALASSAGWLAQRYKELASSNGVNATLGTMPSLAIMKTALKEINPKLDSDAIAVKALQHVQNYEAGLAQQAQGWAPQGYQPGIVGKTLAIAGPATAAAISPATGAALFGMSGGNQARQAAKAGGASPATQELMDIAGSVGGGITGMFGVGSGEFGGVAPTLAERAASGAQSAYLGGGITAGMNALEKLTYNPSKNILDGVSDNSLVMGIIGTAHASGNPVTEEQATQLARFAREDPAGFAKQYGDVIKTGTSNIKSSLVSPDEAPQETPARPVADIKNDMKAALKSGDQSALNRLTQELDAAQSAPQHTGPIELDRSGEQQPQKFPGGRIQLDLPELQPGDLTTEPPPPAPEPKPVEPSPLTEAQTGQQTVIDNLRDARVATANDLEAAKSRVQQLADEGRKGNSKVWVDANNEVNRLTQALSDVTQQLSQNTGKTEEELGWENTKHAWENFKQEMQKPGSQRGAIGPSINPEDGTANIPEALANLVNAGMKDGFKNSSEWLASMRDKMDPNDFNDLYRDVGGVPGASMIWQNNERSSAMMDKSFTSRDTGETFPLQTDVNGNQVTTVGKREGVEATDRPSATVSIRPNGDLHLDGIDNKGVTGTGNEMFRKSVLAALNNGGDEGGTIHAEATPEAREMLSRYKGFEDDGRVVTVPTDSVLGFKTNPTKMKFASAGLNPFESIRDAAEAAKRELGLPEGATDMDLAHEVMGRIGRLGSSVKETAIRIMSKVKGIGRDVAQALAEHLHNAFSGTPESQRGAIGPDINKGLGEKMAKKALEGNAKEPSTGYTPEEEAHYQATIAGMRDKIREAFPDDAASRREMYKSLPTKESIIKGMQDSAYTPQENAHYQEAIKSMRENIDKAFPDQASREEMYKELPDQATVVSKLRGAQGQNAPTLQYRPATQDRKGSVTDAMNRFMDQVFHRNFPTLSDEAGARGGDIARFHEAKASSAIFKANRNIRNALMDMASRPLEDRAVIADALETAGGADTIKDPKMAKAVAFVKAQANELGQALVNAGAIKAYIKDYLHHAFNETPEQIELAIKKKSPTGDLGYFIERHGPDTYAIAKELGLTPKETNPFQNFFDDFINKQKFLMANGTIKGLMDEGYVTKDIQPGFVKLNDYLRNAVSKSKAGEAGEYYAPKSIADVLNNHLGEGFERNIGFRGLRFLNNSMNHVELGLSYFHGMFIMRDMANTLFGSGVTAIARGDFKEGLRQLGLGASPIYGQSVLYQSGKEFRDAIAGQAEMTPELQEVNHAYLLGGGHPDLDPEYINDTMLKIHQALDRVKDVRLDKASRAFWGVASIAEIPLAGIELMAKPIMEHLVPNAKAGAFRELWKVESQRLPPDASDAQIAIVARKLVNDIDDRMGQLVYSNLHLPNGLRQAVTLTTRAGGWVIGSLRAIYGAGFDTAKAVKMLGEDAASKAGLLSPETQRTIEMRRNAQGVWGPKSYVTQRMGYGVASAIGMAITNGMINYVGNSAVNAYNKLKKKPGGASPKVYDTMPHGMDFVFPRIGDTRFSPAGYEKEVVSQWKIWKNIVLHHDATGITDYMSQKASPIVNLAKMSIPPGTDWKGNKISFPSAVLSQYKPISGSDLGPLEMPTSKLAIKRMGGPNPVQTLGKLFGIPPAPKSLIQTDAENQALKILHEDKTPLSQQAANHKDFVNRMALFYKGGDEQVLNDAKNKGLLTQGDLNTIRLKARDTDLLTGVMKSKSITPEEALKIYKDYASTDEQQKLRGIMYQKKMQARRDTPPANMKQWQKDWSAIK